MAGGSFIRKIANAIHYLPASYKCTIQITKSWKKNSLDKKAQFCFYSVDSFVIGDCMGHGGLIGHPCRLITYNSFLTSKRVGLFAFQRGVKSKACIISRLPENF